MKGIVSADTLDELATELITRYRHLTPEKNMHNSLGFNSNPLRPAVDSCYFGCSFTHGEGVESNERWTDLIDNQQGYLSNNFGISGCSIDDIMTVFVAMTKFVKMKKAFFLLPDSARQTIRVDPDDYLGQHYIHVFPNSNKNDPTVKAWFSLPTSHYIDRAQSAINLINYAANVNNIQVYFSSWSPEVFELLPADKRTKNWHANDRQGKDNSHPGPEYHSRVAKEFIELL